MSPKSAPLWIILLMSLFSCVSYQKYSMEVFKPGDKNLPDNMKKVALVARNLKYKSDTLQNYQAKNNRLVKDKKITTIDSLTITSCFDSLANRLLQQSEFDSVLVLPYNTFPVRRVPEIRPAKADWYKKLAAQTRADGLIVLDMFSCFYSSNSELGTANVVTSNIWSVVNAEGKLLDRFAQIDTLYWDQTDETGTYKKYKIPDKKSAISLAAGVIGQNYSRRFLPGWTTVSRDIMATGNSDLQKAANLALKNKWKEATPIWEKYLNSPKRLHRLVSTYNMALSNEMDGNIDRAIELVAEAAKLSSGYFSKPENESVRKYASVLEIRRNEIKKLNQQHETH